MRIIGLGDEIDVIKRECAEAYEREKKEQRERENLRSEPQNS